MVALRKESVDRNRTPHHMNTRPIPSLSARRAWIEIMHLPQGRGARHVALRKESVDRNAKKIGRLLVAEVALRKESVDRNMWWGVRKAVGSLVALRKESVDRNANPVLNA